MYSVSTRAFGVFGAFFHPGDALNILLKSFNSKKSVRTDRMHAIVVSLTGAQAAIVTVAESDERKFQYHAKVYVDEIRASAQIIPKLTGSAITTAFKKLILCMATHSRAFKRLR